MKKARKLIAVILCMTMVLSLVASCKKTKKGASGGLSGDEGGAVATVEVVAPKHSDLVKKIKEAKKTNPKATGWIDIPGTGISYPLILDPDNNNAYWENRNLAGESVKAREESVVYESYLNKADSNNRVVFGHNWNNVSSPFVTAPREGFSMFDLLPAFTDLDFSQNYQYIYVATEEEMKTYQVFSAMYCESDWTPEFGFNYIESNMSDEHFKTYIDEAKKRSELTFDLEVDSKDKLISLSTCTREISNPNNDQRYVVVARELRKGENNESPVNVSENIDVKRPSL